MVFPPAQPELGLAAGAPRDGVVGHPEGGVALGEGAAVVHRLPGHVRPEGLDGGGLALARAAHRLHYGALEVKGVNSI